MLVNTLLQAFLEIGLTQFDLDLYQKILNTSKNKFQKNSSVNVTQIADEMKVSRVKIYQTLHSLKDKNLILFKPNSEDRIVILNPINILNELKYKLNKLKILSNNLEKLIPELSFGFPFDTKQNITEHNGFSEMFVLLQTITDTIPNNGEYIWFNETNELSYFFRDFFFGRYNQERSKRNIKVRILANPDNFVLAENINPSNTQLRIIKYLPKDFSDSTTFTILTDSIVFWNLSIHKAYWIKDKMLAQTQRVVFENYWNNF
jgi:sugar-specific transcriptional regulator TrmB